MPQWIETPIKIAPPDAVHVAYPTRQTRIGLAFFANLSNIVLLYIYGGGARVNGRCCGLRIEQSCFKLWLLWLCSVFLGSTLNSHSTSLHPWVQISTIELLGQPYRKLGSVQRWISIPSKGNRNTPRHFMLGVSSALMGYLIAVTLLQILL